MYEDLYPKPVFERWKEKLLVRLVRKACLYQSFVGIILYGGEGSGKSMIALKLGKAVYGSYKTAMKMMGFLFEDIEELLEQHKPFKVPLVIWDDMGVYANKYLWRVDVLEALNLSATIQLIRTDARALIGTTPNWTELAKTLRHREDWIICKVKRIGRWTSLVSCYRFDISPTGRIYTYTLRSEDGEEAVRVPINIKVPDKVYKQYLKKREKYKALFKQYIEKKRREKRGRRIKQLEPEDLLIE